MDGRIRSKLSFANVVSMIALFVALSGGAYAAVAAKNSVTSKSIKKGAVKSVDLANNKGVKSADVGPNALTGADINEGSLSGVDKCPSGAPNKVGDLCFSSLLGPAVWDTALRDCASRGLRAPTFGEALLLITSDSAGSSTWTDEVTDVPGATRGLVKKDEPKIVAVGTATNQTYHCVAHPGN